MSSETGQNLLLSHIRRLQEDLYSNEDNDYQFTIPSEHEEIWLKIEKTIEHYYQIMSADSSDAMEIFEQLGSQWIYSYENHIEPDDAMELKEFNPDWWETIKFVLLKAQAKEQQIIEIEKVSDARYDELIERNIDRLEKILCQRGEKE